MGRGYVIIFILMALPFAFNHFTKSQCICFSNTILINSTSKFRVAGIICQLWRVHKIHNATVATYMHANCATCPLQIIGPSEMHATSGATSVGHYFWYFGPSEVRATSGATYWYFSEILHGLLTNKNIRIPINF